MTLTSSNAIHGSRISKLNEREREELWRRRLNLFMYLLRSPFYDHATKWLIVLILSWAQAMNIPFAGVIFEAAMFYLPHYRKLYHYLWSK